MQYYTQLENIGFEEILDLAAEVFFYKIKLKSMLAPIVWGRSDGHKLRKGVNKAWLVGQEAT